MWQNQNVQLVWYGTGRVKKETHQLKIRRWLLLSLNLSLYSFNSTCSSVHYIWQMCSSNPSSQVVASLRTEVPLVSCILSCVSRSAWLCVTYTTCLWWRFVESLNLRLWRNFHNYQPIILYEIETNGCKMYGLLRLAQCDDHSPTCCCQEGGICFCSPLLHSLMLSCMYTFPFQKLPPPHLQVSMSTVLVDIVCICYIHTTMLRICIISFPGWPVERKIQIIRSGLVVEF